MGGLFAILALSSMMLFTSDQGDVSVQKPLPPSTASELAPAPVGKSTVLGGEIRSVDPIRDQFTLAIFHGRSLKVLFDERTLVYRDGVRVPVISLKATDHASVETTLDGPSIFALRIHALSRRPEGEIQGSVVRFVTGSFGTLTIETGSAHNTLQVSVERETQIARVGQMTSVPGAASSTDLVQGSVVLARFVNDKAGRAVATHIDVIALPGATFRFGGSISFVDVPGGRLTLQDAHDGQTKDVLFDASRFSISQDLREGMRVGVSAIFDGTKYLAKEITVE